MEDQDKILANVYVATPSYGGNVTTNYVIGLLDLYGTADQYGFGLKVSFNSFDSLVTRARNTMVEEFLVDDRFTHLMWIDGDIGFKGMDVVRLLQANRAVVAGVYPLKTDGWPHDGISEPLPIGTTKKAFQARFARYPATAYGSMLVPDEDGFLDVMDAPTGFMLIKREVFAALMDKFPELRYKSTLLSRPEYDTADLPAMSYAFFDTMIDPDDGTYLSEDYAFCKRLGSIGVTPAIDTKSNLSHQGVAVFHGNLTESLQRQLQALEILKAT